MSNTCPREFEIVRAAAAGELSTTLRQHAAACESCAAAMSVALWMSDLSRIDERQRPLPDPSVLWLKAQLLQGQAAAQRITRPLNVAQMGAYAAVAAGWAGVLTWKWDLLERWLVSLTPSHFIESAGGQATSLPLTFFATLLILASVTVIVALHTILVEE